MQQDLARSLSQLHTPHRKITQPSTRNIHHLWTYLQWLASKTMHIAFRFLDMRDELSTENGLLTKGECLVIPTESRHCYLTDLHEGHTGLNKMCYNTLQSHLLAWHWLTFCRLCQEMSNQHHPQTRTDPAANASSKHPRYTMTEDSNNFLKLHHQKYLLVQDTFSNYPFIIQVHSSKAPPMSNHFEKIFANTRPPKHLYTDNGPPFNWSD